MGAKIVKHTTIHSERISWKRRLTFNEHKVSLFPFSLASLKHYIKEALRKLMNIWSFARYFFYGLKYLRETFPPEESI